MDALKKAVLERKRAALGLAPTEKLQRTDSDDEKSSEDSCDSSDDSDESEQSQKVDVGKNDQAPSQSESDSRLSIDQQDSSSERTIEMWITSILAEWERVLEHRPSSERQTAKGREADRAKAECQEQLQPLLNRLREKNLDASIVEHLRGIVHECEAREYRRAFDRYIQLTIGNAPWPIGVTMVGIHARSGREKIAESKVKHIMKDDIIRSYLTSFKRLMTQCQNLYPPDSYSKRMN